MAFSSFAVLCDLQEKSGVDLVSDYKHDKACQDFIQAITIVERQEIVREVKESCFIAVMGDRSVDITVTEQECVFVRCSISLYYLLIFLLI